MTTVATLSSIPTHSSRYYFAVVRDGRTYFYTSFQHEFLFSLTREVISEEEQDSHYDAFTSGKLLGRTEGRTELQGELCKLINVKGA